MKHVAVILLKRTGWTLLGLLGVFLLVFLAWIASNNRWVDAAPQPWPAALAGPANTLASADNLYAALIAAPTGAGPLSLGDCDAADCGSVWRGKMADWPEQRRKNAAMGAMCERETGKSRVSFQDPVPEVWTYGAALGSYQSANQCSSWLLSQALEASEAGDAVTALSKLRQAERLRTAMQDGSRLLVGHAVSVALFERQLKVITVVAARHPALAAELRALSGLSAADLAAAQRRWIAAEAKLQRGMIQQLAINSGCETAPAMDALDRWLCHVSSLALLPAYAQQLLAADWLRALDGIKDDDPLAGLAHLQALEAAPAKGLFGTSWHWRGTIAHILADIARPFYSSYFARDANAYLAAQATQLWLQARADGVPPERRAAWLGERVRGTPLAERLAIEPDGSWQLQPLSVAELSAKAPYRWPA